MDLDRNKKILLLICLSLFLTILIILAFSSRNSEHRRKLIEKTVIPTSFILKATPPIKLRPTFTGVKKEFFSQEEEQKYNQIFDLKKRLPITLDGFTIKYDYYEDVFVVVLQEPFLENINKFEQWLIENGFNTIPKEKFSLR
jgi:hypothetical protein